MALRSLIWRKYVPIGLSGIILIIIVAVTPWAEVVDKLSDFPVYNLAILTLLGIGYYLSKGLRFWVLLRQLDIRKPLGPIMLLYVAGQPVSILPAGEIYRTALLLRLHNIPIARSSPIILMQGVAEGIVVLSVAVISTLVLGKGRLILLPLVLLLVFAVWVLKTQNTGKYAAKLPFVSLSRERIRKFTRDNQLLLSRGKLPQLLLLSCLPEACGIAIVWIAASGLGLHLGLAQAAIAYSVPLALSAITLLPGGLGASEGSTIGILKLMHSSTATAAAITLVIRVFTLGIGVFMGLIASAFLPKTSNQ